MITVGRRAVACAAGAVLAVSGIVGAATSAVAVPRTAASVGCASPQARVEAALDSLHFPWRNLHYRYIAEPPRSDDLLALTFTGTARRTEVYVQSCAQESDELLRHVLAHEVGHAIDSAWGSTKERRAWLKARGLAASTPWYACNECPVWRTGEGDFVEVFSLWQTGQFGGELAKAPSNAQLRKLIRLIPRHGPATKHAKDPGPGTITVTGTAQPTPPPSTGDQQDPAPAPAPVPTPDPTSNPTPLPTPDPAPSQSCVYVMFFPVCH